MSKYTAEQVIHAADLEQAKYDGDLIISGYLRDYAALLRERESAKAVVTDAVAYWAAISDDGEIVVAYSANDGNEGEAARTECNQYINDALLNDRAALRLVPLYEAGAPMLASARVPDARKLRLNGNVRQQSFDQGWNACRDAMLAAAPKE